MLIAIICGSIALTIRLPAGGSVTATAARRRPESAMDAVQFSDDQS
jgi:hypothetical protein